MAQTQKMHDLYDAEEAALMVLAKAQAAVINALIEAGEVTNVDQEIEHIAEAAEAELITQVTLRVND